MPSAGDPRNLAHNLRVITGLSANLVGTKLSFDKDTGRFTAQEPGKWTSFVRTFSRDSITKEDWFGDPIRDVFAAAKAGIAANTVTQLAFDDAIAGLRTLRVSYADDAARLRVLNSVIEDAEIGVRKDVPSAIALREKYKNRLIYAFAQRMFLPDTNGGVCYSFTVDWARRILSAVRPKASFAESKKRGAIAVTTTLDITERRRMMKKVDRRIRPTQEAIRIYGAGEFGGRLAAVTQSDEATPQMRKFATVLMFPVQYDPVDIGARDRGSVIIAAARRVAEQHQARLRDSLFVLSLRQRGGGGGHAVAFRLHDGIHFFDPNIGEFYFPTPFARAGDEFFDEWWRSFYMIGGATQYFGTWTLEAVRARG